MMAFGAIWGVVGVVIIQLGGGWAYDNISKAAPFFICTVMLSISAITGLLLGLCGKLKG